MMIPTEQIAPCIIVLRGHRVMLDEDLADLYGVATKVLLQSVRRNLDRFPADFLFLLTKQDIADLRSQSVTSSFKSWGGRRRPPYAFTEQGVAMLSSVLRSKRAIAVNIAIMRAFVRLRALAGNSAELTRKLDALDQRVSGHDEAIRSIVRAIRELAGPPVPARRRIGFV